MDRPLKILHVVVNMNRGGAETLIMNLYRHIDRSKVQFHFLTFKPGVFDEEIIGLGGKIHRLPYITDCGHRHFIHELKLFFKEHHTYTVIHSHLDKMSGFILKTAAEANIRVRIAHAHNTNSEGGWLAKTYKWYAGTHILKHATHFYACSQKAAEWLFGKRANKAIIFKNGISVENFKFSNSIRSMMREKLGINEDTFLLGHVGRFLHQKNHAYLLDIVATLHKIVPNIQLVLVGDGPLKRTIEQKANRLNISEHILFLGVRSDINHLLQAFDMFLMPSFHEGLPVTLIEAQSSGLPCIISDTITTEVDIGLGLIHYLPLEHKINWINTITKVISEQQLTRNISEHALAQKGYDITKTAGKTVQTYLTLGEKAI